MCWCLSSNPLAYGYRLMIIAKGAGVVILVVVVVANVTRYLLLLSLYCAPVAQ